MDPALYEEHRALSTGWNRMPCTADGKNAKGRQQSFLQGYMKAKTKFTPLPRVSAPASNEVVYVPVCCCHAFWHELTHTCMSMTIQDTRVHAYTVKFSASPAAHQHDWVIFRRNTTGLAFPQSREYFVEVKVLQKGNRNRGLWECCVKYIWETDGENAKKRDRRKADQMGMDAQSCLLIPNVKKTYEIWILKKCILQEQGFFKKALGSDLTAYPHEARRRHSRLHFSILPGTAGLTLQINRNN